jgi:hypothetical protein
VESDVVAHTLTWWSVLCTIAALNVLAWAWSVRALRHNVGSIDAEEVAFRRLQLLLSAGYVAGCAWRSAVPVYDVPRLCLIDSWVSSVAIGRSVATVAELCFAAQWALLLRAVSTASGSALARASSRLLVPLILVAETCSWHAVLTTSNLGHVIEESLWGVCATLTVASLLWINRRVTGAARVFALGCSLGGLAYVVYMFSVDVPMYWARWLADEARGRVYFDVAAGFADASGRWVVSHRWTEWRGEVLWMTLYFSVAVWVSIGLAHAPILRPCSTGRRPSPTV